MKDEWQRTPSGLILPAKEIHRRPIAVSTFTGAGGFDLGMVQAGFHVAAAVEMDVEAAATYLNNLGSDRVKMHFVTAEDDKRMTDFLMRWGRSERRSNAKLPPEARKADIPSDAIPPWIRSGWNRRNVMPDYPGCGHIWIGDVRKVTGQEILDALGLQKGDVDCVFGGPPCQGFSVSGRREVMDPRNSLVFDFARLVVEIQPKAFVMENVPGITSMVTAEGIPVVDAMCRVMEDGGFAAYDAIKKSLLATSGAGAAVRGTIVQKAGKPKKAEKEQRQQPSLF